MLKNHLINTAPIYHKNFQQICNRRNIPQHNKGHIQVWCWLYVYANIILNGQKLKFSPKIRHKTRVSTFSTSIQHSIGSSTHRDQIRKRNKKYANWKGGSKLSLFADDMIVYIENPIDTIKKWLKLINEFGKTVGYKVNIQKSMEYLYTNNEITETEMRGKSHLL